MRMDSSSAIFTDAQLMMHDHRQGGAAPSTSRAADAYSILETEAWAIYVEQMSELGHDVVFGVATPDPEEASLQSAVELTKIKRVR